MRKRAARAGVSGALLVLLAFTAQEARASYDTANAENGRKVFRLCASCHSLIAGENKVGPSLHGLLGRNAGAVDGFRYSKALATAGIVGDEGMLDLWLANPRKLVRGTRMRFPGVRKAKDRTDLIAYLKEAAGGADVIEDRRAGESGLR